MAERRLERSEDDRVIAGVCGGIAAYLGSDATWVRIAWIVITILTSVLPMVIIYVVLAAILPTAPHPDSTAPAGSGGGTSISAPAAARPGASTSGRDAAGRPDWGILFGGVLLAVGALLLLAQFVPVRWDIVWPASLIVLGGVIILVALRPRSR